jgi:hypothetical protein
VNAKNGFGGYFGSVRSLREKQLPGGHEGGEFTPVPLGSTVLPTGNTVSIEGVW